MGEISGTPLGVLVGRLAQADPHRPAITCGSDTVTRAELEARTNRLARAYRGLGVTPGIGVEVTVEEEVESGCST